MSQSEGPKKSKQNPKVYETFLTKPIGHVKTFKTIEKELKSLKVHEWEKSRSRIHIFFTGLREKTFLLCNEKQQINNNVMNCYWVKTRLCESSNN